jgi:hypothetical protein
MPSARKVALIRHSANVALDLQVGETRTASSQLGIDLVVFELGGAQELEGAFCAAKRTCDDDEKRQRIAAPRDAAVMHSTFL